jgi:flagellar basal body-associated protein FliL
MPNKSTTTEPKSKSKYAKTRGEHFKDLIIVALVVAIAAFVGGMVFANSQQTEVKNAVSAAQVTAPAVATTPAPTSK